MTKLRTYRRLFRIRSRFMKLWKSYLYQSSLAGAVVAIVLFILHINQAVVVASIGATAFIVFTMPKLSTAHPRRVVGGHIIGLACGSVMALIPHSTVPISVIVYSVTVGLSIFLMVASDFEHPPASGTALGVAISGFSLNVALAVIASSILLALAHHLLKRNLKDLLADKGY